MIYFLCRVIEGSCVRCVFVYCKAVCRSSVSPASDLVSVHQPEPPDVYCTSPSTHTHTHTHTQTHTRTCTHTHTHTHTHTQRERYCKYKVIIVRRVCECVYMCVCVCVWVGEWVSERESVSVCVCVCVCVCVGLTSSIIMSTGLTLCGLILLTNLRICSKVGRWVGLLARHRRISWQHERKRERVKQEERRSYIIIMRSECSFCTQCSLLVLLLNIWAL